MRPLRGAGAQTSSTWTEATVDAVHFPTSNAQDEARTCGHILSVSGSQASVGLPAESIDPEREASITVGKFLRIQRAQVAADRHGHRGDAGHRPQSAHEQGFRAAARLDMMGEIKQRDDGKPYFQRGVTDYPAIGDPAALITRDELRLIYDISGSDTIDIGHLQQDASDRRLHQCRRDAEQAFRRARHHRRRQVERRRADPARRSSTRGRTCGCSCSTATTNMRAASATARWCSIRAT